MGWFLSSKRRKGILGRQALHSGSVGMKINLSVAVTIYKFYRAVLYSHA